MNNYISEMEGEYAEKQPLTMMECAKIAEECLTGRLSVSLTNIYSIVSFEILNFSPAHNRFHNRLYF